MRGGNVGNPNGVGGFRPGQSGNPGGRAQSVSAIKLAALRECLKAVETLALVRDGKGGPDASVRVAASNSILAYGIGKPMQTIDMALSMRRQIMEMDADQLAAAERHILAERGAIEQALLAAPPTLPTALAVMEEQEREEQEQASLLDRMEGANGNGADE